MVSFSLINLTDNFHRVPNSIRTIIISAVQYPYPTKLKIYQEHMIDMIWYDMIWYDWYMMW